MAKAKDIEQLDCHADAREGMRLALLTRLSEICEAREAALDFTDIKGVHDMRVATRRLRSMVRDFKPFLRKRFPQNELKVLADVLGGVRDQDVALKYFEKLLEGAEESVTAGLMQLADERRMMREEARAKLQKSISAEAVQKFHEKLTEIIERATEVKAAEVSEQHAPKKSIKGVLSFAASGREIIAARFAEIEATGISLCRPDNVEQLHEMRIAAKRLRYAVELFTPYCGGGRLQEFSEEVAELQKSLGELHDLDLWIAELGGRLEKFYTTRQTKSQQSRRCSSSTLRPALIWLLGRCVKERAEHYRDALMRWQQWRETDFAARLNQAYSHDT
ncbi:MAG: CHAD domain-containing protein [Acidobacteriota bacterium]|nr:CHAD domain-containing protein [Acidobacteriota bacterium]